MRNRHLRTLLIRVCDSGQGLVWLGIEHVQYGSNQERATRLLPMVSLVERPIRIDEAVRDALDIPHLPFDPAYFGQWIVGGGVRIGRIE